MAAPLAAPHLVMYDDFLIEAYRTITFVPFATVSEQRGSIQKTAEHERQDELYGRCRICCSSNRPGEHMLLCDSCDRAFHIGCLHPRLKDIPKGEWHCANCTSETLYNQHSRAATVANFRNVMLDIHNFPSLPLKLRFKMLDLFATKRAPPADHTPNGQLSVPHPPPRRPLRSLPPKERCKRMRTSSQPDLQNGSTSATDTDVPLVSNGLRVAPARNVVRLARDLQPVAHMLRNEQALHVLSVLETHFSSQQMRARAVGAMNKQPS